MHISIHFLILKNPSTFQELGVVSEDIKSTVLFINKAHLVHDVNLHCKAKKNGLKNHMKLLDTNPNPK
jgi:type II secretory ATPase GspE/PulE/Tfp pilus assembly ATPase PilB-like protein